MKIDSSTKTVGSTGTSAGARTRPGGNSGATAASVGATTASLGGLQEAQAALDSTPVVNTDRIAEIKQAIAEGRFQVNPERIADGLIDSVRQMLSSANG